ncbi:putative phospholipase B-like 2 [Rhipicephalus sanguineus]|uniref:putative phospholipase B-like 2 n=1 Tax=Rhipicephalus sanguineus TaxID=34632 RepID=UPI0020C26203|nr:putative phospholipase B-like 2 [Rhipicephalus sanguineus]
MRLLWPGTEPATSSSCGFDSAASWAFLQIETNERAKDEVQAYAAGALEAYLTRQLIEYHWTNMFGGYCDSQPEYCRKLEQFLAENNKYSQQQQDLRKNNESFCEEQREAAMCSSVPEVQDWILDWAKRVNLQMKQLTGLSDEFENNALDYSNELTDVPRVQYLNAQGDIQDLEHALGRETDFYSIDQIMACSAVVKVVGDNEGLIFGHDAWFVYRAMLRFQKHYIFPWHLTASQTEPEDVVPGHTWTISSYPGMLMSWDSFYLTSGGLAITETQLLNNNEELQKQVTPSGGIPGWIRAAVASRLATSGEEWVRIMATENGGTANSQNLVVDFKLFTPGQPVSDGTLYLLERMPGFAKYEDVSHGLRDKKYWPGYNVAYFPEVFEMTAQPENIKKYGRYYSYDECPRARMFQRDNGKLTDVDSVVTYLRYNDYKNDPLSRCNCTPPYNPVLAISARTDLLDPNGQYDAPAMNRRAVGGIDAKVTSNELFPSLEFVGESGPTWRIQPPFQWSTSGLADSHLGQPDKWQFKPIQHKWEPALRSTSSS